MIVACPQMVIIIMHYCSHDMGLGLCRDVYRWRAQTRPRPRPDQDKRQTTNGMMHGRNRGGIVDGSEQE
jgi:hypothetical protein